METKIIAFINHKGGAGKTTTTLNLAAGLQIKGKKVLIVDLDPQANLTIALGFLDEKQTINEALRGGQPLVPIQYKRGLDIVCSSFDLAGAELFLATETGGEFILKELLKPCVSKYDYILIDCAPSLGLLSINALVAANFVIIPVEAQFFAMQGMAKIINVVNKVKTRLNSALIILGVVITKYEKSTALSKFIVDAVKSKCNVNLFNTLINKNTTLAESPMEGKDIFSYAPNCNGAKDYMQFTEEIINLKN